MYSTTNQNYTLSLHDALPISPFPPLLYMRQLINLLLAPKYFTQLVLIYLQTAQKRQQAGLRSSLWKTAVNQSNPLDRKSTRLNSSHVRISYAVFCLKKTTVNS